MTIRWGRTALLVAAAVALIAWTCAGFGGIR
jgi:hypothetical protein